MDKEIKSKWIEALRSGDYIRGICITWAALFIVRVLRFELQRSARLAAAPPTLNLGG